MTTHNKEQHAMPIELDEPTEARPPVVRHKVIGEKFTGMLIGIPDQRNALKDGEPIVKPGVSDAMLAEPQIADGKKYKQELVVPLIALPGCTMQVALGEDVHTPEAGEIVRMIIKGLTFSQWIDAYRKLDNRKRVGDIIITDTTHGQAYDANGKPTGGELLTQAECDLVPRDRALGFYGTLTINRPDLAVPAHAEWAQKAEAAYAASKVQTELDAAPTGAAARPSVDDVFG